MLNQNQVLEKVITTIPKQAHQEETLQIACIIANSAQTDHTLIPLLFGFLSDQILINQLLREH